MAHTEAEEEALRNIARELNLSSDGCLTFRGRCPHNSNPTRSRQICVKYTLLESSRGKSSRRGKPSRGCLN